MMPTIRKELIHEVINKAYILMDYNIHNDIHKRHEFQKKSVLNNKSLTRDEKTEAIRLLNEKYDRNKIKNNDETKRICENCNQECLATKYCEHCVRNYLKAKFSNWTSGNDDIDNLIRNCQMESLTPSRIIEWIPYNNLQNITYLTKGGCSEIYIADWIDGGYKKWHSTEQQLKRFGTHKVILKKLKNVESANQSWFEEAKSHLTVSNKWPNIVQSFGLTQEPSNGNYMLIMTKRDTDLRDYLRQNHNELTWEERIGITLRIIYSLYFIHKENAIHRDLHSGNILYSKYKNSWCISDLGCYGPADKPPKSIYGNLPYIAPEVIARKGTTFASDIYSIGMLMWEISSGQQPFTNYQYDSDFSDFQFAMKIVNGMRPKIVSPDIPLEYKSLMKQCWDADPLERPDIDILITKISLLYNQTITNKSNKSKIFNLFLPSRPKTNNNLEINRTNSTNSRLFTSKVYQFENLPEPKNATEEEQEAFHSKSYDFNIPDNIDDFDKSNDQNNNCSLGIRSIFKDIKNDYKKKAIYNQIKKHHVDIDVDVYNNPNLHPEEQDKLEISDDLT